MVAGDPIEGIRARIFFVAPVFFTGMKRYTRNIRLNTLKDLHTHTRTHTHTHTQGVALRVHSAPVLTLLDFQIRVAFVSEASAGSLSKVTTTAATTIALLQLLLSNPRRIRERSECKFAL
jgi:hypothetical protein